MVSFKNILNVYKKYRTLILTIVALVAILLPIVLVINHSVDIFSKLKAYPYIGADVAYKNTISVRGEGRIYTKPDVAIIDLSIVTEGKNVKDVQDENSEKMNKVVEFLKEFGVAEKDIKTKSYRIYPRYRYEDRRIPSIIGYEINQTLEVKIREMERIGEVLERSVSVGINQVSSLNFKVDDDKKVKEQARALAIEDAKKKARTLASQLGIKLIRISGFDEVASFDYPIYREFGIGGGPDTAPIPQIQVGENEIVVNVTLIYEIN